MRERIIELLEAKGLSNSKFAEMIDIQKSSVSHFLRGRNNPSLEVVVKILKTFKEINPDWLLLGEGTMYKSEAKNESPPTLFHTENEVNTVEEKSNELDKSLAETSTENTKKVEPAKPQHKAERIIIFNSDKSFEEYFPK